MTKHRSALSILAATTIFATGLSGCDKSSSSSPRSLMGEPSDAMVTKLPALGTKAAFYSFGPADSKIGFTGAKITKKHEGAFGSFQGKIGLVGGDPKLSAVTAEIDVASLTVDPEKLGAHLKSPDFFDAAKFPKVTFSSTTIRPGEGATNFNVTGRLEMHGVSKPITFPATIRTSPEEVEVDAEFNLNRKDFGIVYPGAPDDLIKDDVAIKLTLRAKPLRPAAPSPVDAHVAD